MYRLVLLGGNGFHDSLIESWKLLAGIQKQVFVVSPPYAAIAKHYLQHSRIATAYFEEIGLKANIIEGEELDMLSTVDKIKSASLVYLPGADLRSLCAMPEQKQLPAAWSHLLGEDQLPSTCIALSAANAVAVGEATFVPIKPFSQKPEDQQYERVNGLGWIKNTVIFPDWDSVPVMLANWFTKTMFSTMTCVGIDTHCALCLTDEGWQVLGAGSVHIYQQSVEQIFETNQTIPTSLMSPELLRG